MTQKCRPPNQPRPGRQIRRKAPDRAFDRYRKLGKKQLEVKGHAVWKLLHCAGAPALRPLLVCPAGGCKLVPLRSGKSSISGDKYRIEGRVWRKRHVFQSVVPLDASYGACVSSPSKSKHATFLFSKTLRVSVNITSLLTRNLCIWCTKVGGASSRPATA